jgi:predicted PurR-regulated permease PerM
VKPHEPPDSRFLVLLLCLGLFLVLFLWSVHEVLAPLILFLVIVYLLGPLFGTPLYGRVVTVLGALTLLWLIWSVGFILTPFVLALVLAYILNPLVSRGVREGMNRTLATAAVLGTFLALFVLTAAAVGPLLWSQLVQFGGRLPEFLEGAVRWTQGTLDRIAHVPLPGVGRLELGDVLDIDASRLEEFLAERGAAIQEALLSSVVGVGKGLGVALTVLSYLLVTPILTFFLLRDFETLVKNAGRLVPPRRRGATFTFVREFDELLGLYLRSQLVVSILVGVIIGVGFWIAGFPYALLLGAVAGIFNIVPYLGLALSLIPAILIALVSGDVGVDLLKIAIVFGAEQALENWFSPKIVGSSVGLHPVWVLLAIVLFSFFFGVIGLLIAVPAAVGIKLLLRNVIRTYERSAYYGGAATELAGAGATGVEIVGPGSQAPAPPEPASPLASDL